MADEENVEQAAPAKAPLAGKKRLMIIGMVVAVQIPLVILVGNKLIKPKLVPSDTASVVAQGETGRGTIMLLEDITVNLMGTDRARFLRVSIGLELENDRVTAEIDERKAEIRDVVIGSISGRRVDQLISVEGKEQLKKELKERIDSKLQEGSVLKVYFSDFVVQ